MLRPFRPDPAEPTTLLAAVLIAVALLFAPILVGQAAAAEGRGGDPVYVVPGKTGTLSDETVGDVAQQTLGDRNRWPEIVQSNRGRTQPDGRPLRAADDRLQSGWTVQLPAGARRGGAVVQAPGGYRPGGGVVSAPGGAAAPAGAAPPAAGGGTPEARPTTLLGFAVVAAVGTGVAVLAGGAGVVVLVLVRRRRGGAGAAGRSRLMAPVAPATSPEQADAVLDRALQQVPADVRPQIYAAVVGPDRIALRLTPAAPAAVAGPRPRRGVAGPELAARRAGAGRPHRVPLLAPLGTTGGEWTVGPITDRIGRRVMYTADLLAMIIPSVLCLFIHGAWLLIALRFIIGAAIGADYPIATTLLSEWMPKKQRGPMIGLLSVFWLLGAIVAFLVGFVMTSMWGPGCWRWMLASGAAWGLLVLLLRLGTHESPRWLIAKGRIDQARNDISSVLGRPVTEEEVLSLTHDEEPEHKSRFSELLRGDYLRRIVFCGLFWMCFAIPQFALFTFINGTGNILVFIYPNELFPTQVRASAVGLATAISRIGAAVGTYLVPLALSGLGNGPTMLIGAAVTLLGFVISIFWAEETRDRPLAAAAHTPELAVPNAV